MKTSKNGRVEHEKKNEELIQNNERMEHEQKSCGGERFVVSLKNEFHWKMSNVDGECAKI